MTVGLAVSPFAAPCAGTSCDLTYEDDVEEQLSPGVREAVENGVHSSYLQGNGVSLQLHC